MLSHTILVRELETGDLEDLAAPGRGAAWHGGMPKWERRMIEHRSGDRYVAVAEDVGRLVGYGSLVFQSAYEPFRRAKIPEIQDLVVAENFRGRGAGTMLIERLEDLAAGEGYTEIGLGVGLYGDYGRAQRLYTKLGYRPDGRGVAYRGEPVPAGSTVRLDDDLLLWLAKRLG
ncbi:MAG: GNAT family N-acetyltransferase [Bryobacterales bacterium]|nr:GNAT family N-acetyltransferase [Bryobacterales bacterium]